MSYEVSVCPRCGAYAHAVEGGYGRCSCGAFIPSSWDGINQIKKDNLRFFMRKLRQVCRGKASGELWGYDSIKVTVYNEHDKRQVENLARYYADGYLVWSRERETETYYAELSAFCKTVDFDEYKLRPYRYEGY